MESPHVRVQKFGQSIWYDNIRRGLITSGELHDLVTNGGVLGVTSNPAIFEKAIAGSTDYDQALRALVQQDVGSAQALYERIAIEDIQLTADVLRPTYDRTSRRDGYSSLEVSPYLAHDTGGTVEEARRLFEAIGRENVMIKVPATTEGIPAVRQLIGDGINVNVTLIFYLDTYREVAAAYVSGLEDLLQRGGDPATVASVASFFISRIDSAIDHELTSRLDMTEDADRRRQLKERLGTIAIANARLAYAHLRELRADERWKALEAKGARPQRLLWASTGTKNPKYSKTLYVDELIGPDTVNTVPTETYHTFAASGRPRASLTENWAEALEQAQESVDGLDALGISFKKVTDTLLAGGVTSFSDAFDKLLAAVEKKRQALLGKAIAQQQYALGDAQADVDATLDEWRRDGRVRRLWAKDPAVWTGTDENEWLGWLYVVEAHSDEAEALETLVEDVRRAGFRHVMLLGMGGSSLCAEVLRQTVGRIDGYPELLVLDSIVPAQVKAFEERIDPSRTLFLVSSKSGGTTETAVLKQYFMDKVSRAGAGDAAGRNFVAITDPGTKLHKRAKRDRFRSIRHGEPSIGGRYSALSNFGLVPAALMGIDVKAFLDRTDIMVQACASCVPPETNPGVTLGAVLGTLAKRGREKVTIIVSPSVRSLAAWLEQLLAESTGKLGTGLIPVADERLGAPDVYGDDRLFVYAHLNSDRCPELDAGIDALAAAGHPVVRLSIDDRMDIGQAFFRWEVGTAVAGSILGDQPLRPARRRGGQAGDAPADGRLRGDRRAAAALADRERRRPGALRAGTGGRGAAVRSEKLRPRGAARGPPGAHPARRLLRRDRLPGDERREPRAAPGHPPRGPGREAGGDDTRLRTTLPALDGPAAQGRAGYRGLPTAHLRRCRGPPDSWTALHIRCPEASAGSRRLRGAGGARPSIAARAPREGPRRGADPTGRARPERTRLAGIAPKTRKEEP